MFSRLRQVPPTVVYCVVMLAVPIVYPRLVTVEKALTGVAVAKKGVNGAFNLLGKAVTSVTPAGSATESTHSAFDGVKKAFGKSGLMSSVVSKFGEVDLLGTFLPHTKTDLRRSHGPLDTCQSRPGTNDGHPYSPGHCAPTTYSHDFCLGRRPLLRSRLSIRPKNAPGP